ncbi:unnamed protein product [Lota lota]
MVACALRSLPFLHTHAGEEKNNETGSQSFRETKASEQLITTEVLGVKGVTFCSRTAEGHFAGAGPGITGGLAAGPELLEDGTEHVQMKTAVVVKGIAVDCGDGKQVASPALCQNNTRLRME